MQIQSLQSFHSFHEGTRNVMLLLNLNVYLHSATKMSFRNKIYTFNRKQAEIGSVESESVDAMRPTLN